MYSKNVLDHFKNPRNMGAMENPDAEATVGNPTCGDVMKIMIKVEDSRIKDVKNAPSFRKIGSLESENLNGRTVEASQMGNFIISDIKFQTMGCVAAIATSSMTTEMAKGKSLEEAKNITNKDVAKALGDLPPIKVHCSNLAADALKEAIENFEQK
ncbi:iron-sulfur cluster assembly scaffold protein [Candidatus Pacearchaeota archaeon]|nr:iron-sulfur cluster assembly scaffold protein [Candidatus Pacearchaeota archaeon]